MSSIFIFLLKVVICSGIFYIYYFIFLRNKKLHHFNRAFLLLSIPGSLSIPLLNWRIYSLEILPSHDPGASPYSQTYVDSVVSFSWEAALVVAFVGLGFVLLVSLIVRICRMMILVKRHFIQPMNGFYFIESDLEQAPFSFFDKLFWKKTISVEEPAGERIFMHELAHIRQRHSHDKLFTQLVCCIFWVNPFYWLIQRELSMVHEFLADAASIDEGDSETFAQMLLRSVNNGQYLSPSQAFFNSSVQRRLTMISSSQKTGYSFERKYLIIPILILLSTILSCTITRKMMNATQMYSMKPSDVPEKPLTAQLKPAAPEIEKPKTSSTSHPKPSTTKKDTKVEFTHLKFPEKNSSPPGKNDKSDGALSPGEIIGIKSGNSSDGAGKKEYSERYSTKPRVSSEKSKESTIKRSFKEEG